MDHPKQQELLFIVIPAYNEASVIAATLAPLMAANHKIIVVDDCSRDGTWSVLENLPVIRIRHTINLGQGAALQTGMEYALQANADIVVHFDADGQHDANQILAIVEPIQAGRADVVFGSRFLRSSDLGEIPPSKRALLRVGRIVSGLITGVWLSDTHNGFRAMSKTAIESIRLRENGFAHATEILDEVRRARLRYVEVPTTIRYTDYSRAKGQPISNAFNILLDMIVRKLFS
jgi:polyprenyl-phospho-N-acetylgalactosaminyl synthase